MDIFVIILCILIGAYIVFVIGLNIAFFNFGILRKPRRKNTDFPPNASRSKQKDGFDKFRTWFATQDVKDIYIKSFDNLNLCTRILEHKNSKKVVIMMHGFRAQDNEDFAGSVRIFYENGFNILLPYQRSHEKSEGKYISYGAHESKDCKSWAEFAVDRYGKDCEIVLYGVSMGSATVCLSLVQDLPSNVKCAIADCGYNDARSIYKHVLGHSYHVPIRVVLFFLRYVCKKIAKFDFEEVSPKRALQKNKIPVLFIHGEKDRFVPVNMGIENYENCASEKELLIIKDASHAISFLVEPEKCWNACKNFIDKFFDYG